MVPHSWIANNLSDFHLKLTISYDIGELKIQFGTVRYSSSKFHIY